MACPRNSSHRPAVKPGPGLERRMRSNISINGIGGVRPATGEGAPQRTAAWEGAPSARLPGTVHPAHCRVQGYRGQCALACCCRGRCAPLLGIVRPGALPSAGLLGTVRPGALPRTVLPGKAAPVTSLVHCYQGPYAPVRCCVGCCRSQGGPAHCHAHCSPARVSGLQACISANPALVGHSPTQLADPSLLLTLIIWADIGCLMVDELIPSGLLQYYWVRSTICPGE